MIRYRSMMVVAFAFSMAMVAGGTQLAQAQCQNGKCCQNGMCPLTSNNVTVVGTSTANAPNSSYVVDYNTVTSVVSPIIENTSNIISYSSNFPLPTTINNCVGWSCCGSNNGQYFAPVQTWSTPFPTYYPTSTSYPLTSSCSGGACNPR